MAIFYRLNPQERGYYYVLLVGVVMLSYGLTELAHASGMLAAFRAGLVMGNSRFVYRQGVSNFAAALAMIANIGVFVLMGVLVFPSQWADLWLHGILLFVVLTFVVWPVAVWLGRGIFADAFWPVRVEAPTRYGIVTARLVSLESADATPSN